MSPRLIAMVAPLHGLGSPAPGCLEGKWSFAIQVGAMWRVYGRADERSARCARYLTVTIERSLPGTLRLIDRFDLLSYMNTSPLKGDSSTSCKEIALHAHEFT